MSIVRIPFPVEPTQAFKEQSLSSGELMDSGMSIFTGADVIGTTIRCTGFSGDYEQVQGQDADTHGLIIDFTADHHWMAWIIYGGTLAVTFLFACYYWEKIKKTQAAAEAAAVGSYQQIKTTLRLEHKSNFLQDVQSLNEHVANLSGYLPNEGIYENISLSEEQNKKETIRFLVLKKKSKTFLTAVGNVARALINAASIFAFTYWLEWIAGSIGVGTLGIGVPGLAAVGYIFPVILAGSWLAYRMYHWGMNHLGPQRQAPTATEVQEVAALIQQLKRKDELAAEKPQTPKAEETRKRGQALTRAPVVSFGYKEYLEVAAYFLIKLISAYCLGHFVLWPIGDLLPVLINNFWLQNGCAFGLFFFALVEGSLAAKNRAAELKAELAQNQIANEQEFTALKSACEIKLNQIKHLQLESKLTLQPLQEPAAKLREDEKTKTVAYSVYDFMNQKDNKILNPIILILKALALSMGGNYIARLFVFTKTSSFIPFAIHCTTAAAVLSPLAAYLIVVGVTIAWGLFRLEIWKKEQEKLNKAAELKAKIVRYEEWRHLSQQADLQLKRLQEEKRSGSKISVAQDKEQKEFKTPNYVPLSLENPHLPVPLVSKSGYTIFNFSRNATSSPPVEVSLSNLSYSRGNN
jgi:hypothetical protein